MEKRRKSPREESSHAVEEREAARIMSEGSWEEWWERETDGRGVSMLLIWVLLIDFWCESREKANIRYQGQKKTTVKRGWNLSTDLVFSSHIKCGHSTPYSYPHSRTKCRKPTINVKSHHSHLLLLLFIDSQRFYSVCVNPMLMRPMLDPLLRGCKCVLV